MARGRLVSKSLGSSRKFHALSAEGGKLAEFCQALFPLIVAHTDDFGRLEADAFTIKHLVWPTSARSERDFDVALNALHATGLIQRYGADGGLFLQVACFDEHQPGLNKAKRTKSKFPEPPSISREPREIPSQGKGREGKGSEEEDNGRELRDAQEQPAFEVFWDAYPRKVGKPKAESAFRKVNPSGPVLEAMLVAIVTQKRSAQWTRDGGEFIPHPATWLNQRRWEDELPKAAQTLSYQPSAHEAYDRWPEECRRLHGDECGNYQTHQHRLMRDARPS